MSASGHKWSRIQGGSTWDARRAHYQSSEIRSSWIAKRRQQVLHVSATTRNRGEAPTTPSTENAAGLMAFIWEADQEASVPASWRRRRTSSADN